MDQARLNRISTWIPLICSALAFAIVMANILDRVPPQPDENASAHLWQLLMAVQLPLIAVFLATADWSRWRRPVTVLTLQVMAILAAAVPVWLAGY